MTYKAWLSMNVKYENKLLDSICKKHGKLSKQFRRKAEQIEALKTEIKISIKTHKHGS